MRRGCTVPDCTRKHDALGLCHLHYDRVRSGVPLSQPLPRPAQEVIEDVEWLLRCGTSPAEVAERVGYPTNVRSMVRRLQRHGRFDLATHFKSIVYRERYGAA